jgi:cyclohexyl-isocyanide hydratase
VSAPPTAIGMLVFDGMTRLDFGAPFDVFARMPQTAVHVLSPAGRDVATDLGKRVHAPLAMADAPPLDVLFVGGGPGVDALMEDAAVLGWLAARAPDARWVTSVCTGALVLGAAGLLRGYRASTHWAAREILRTFGAEPSTERVCIDRDRATGGGVTAGLDFALRLAVAWHGEDRARGMQLGMEYDPAPPFPGGSPETSPPAVVERVRAAMAARTAERAAIAERVRARPGWPGT